jgi:hypothetical protein
MSPMQMTALLPTTNPDTGSFSPWMMPPRKASQITQSAVSVEKLLRPVREEGNSFKSIV